MADLQRNDSSALITEDHDLHKQWIQISINEKLNLIETSKSTLNRMKSVDQKRIELNIQVTEKEIAKLKNELQSITPVVVDAEVVPGEKT